MNDLRFALRQLRKSPGFTFVAVLTLALGIGANTAIFSVINAALIKALPYHEPDRIVLVWGDSAKQNLHRGQVSSTDVADFRARNHVFSAISTYSDFRPILAGEGEPERLSGAQVGDDFFQVMDARPFLGRVFTAAEQVGGKDDVAILSYGLWQRRFASDPKVVGKTFTLSGHTYTVIGVMPENFQSLPAGLLETAAQFYRPVAEPPNDKQRSGRHLRAIARLKSGVTVAQAQSEMSLIARQLEEEHPEMNAGYGVHLVSLRDDLVRPLRPVLLLLFGAVGFLLFIACANVGNLLLARSLSRQREVAIRTALGASRSQIVRQFLTEGVLLSSLGGFVGFVIALWGTALLENIAAYFFPQLGGVEVDARVLAFTFALSLGAGVFLGLIPALRATSNDLGEALNDAARSPGAVSTRSALRSSLVIIEVALAMTLLIGAGLLLQSMRQLQKIDPGFRPDHLLTMNVWLPGAKYPKDADALAFYRRLEERLRTVPGIKALGLTSIVPAGTNFDGRTVAFAGRTIRPGAQPEVDNYTVTPDYLHAMGVPLRSGRFLNRRDDASAPLAVLVSESMAKQYWPNENPLGQRLRFYGGEPNEKEIWRTVVGVVGDVKQYGLDAPGKPALYESLAQYPTPFMSLVVRTETAPGDFALTIRREILALDPEEAVFNVATMDDLLRDSTALRRFAMFLLGAFAGLALLLAAIGLYGVISYSVAQRTREMGIRITLGAQRRDLLGLVLREGIRFVALGIGVGLLASLALTRLLTSLLFAVSTTDPLTFLAFSLALAAVALLACLLPAGRACAVDPAVALRAE